MRSLRITILIVAACLSVAVALPAGALAAPGAAAPTASSKPAAVTAPLASGPIDAQIWPGQDGKTVVIVDVTLDPKVKLPARVRIPVPNGAVVQWAGEILGGDASKDQERPFTLQSGHGGSYAELTLSVSRRGQIETNGIAMTASGTKLSTLVDWTQSVPSTSTLFTVRIPANVSAVTIAPQPVGAPDTNAAGESLYVLPTQSLATGAQSVIKVSYDTAPATATPATTVNLTAVYIVLGVLLAGAVAVVVYLASRQNAAGSGDEGYDDSDAEDGDVSEAEPDDDAAPNSTDEADDDAFDID
ncbi:MAG: hypothetical protein P4L93_08710 [Coriobacteriia bacterium]|nr:hypothetical protein [Coriobacteriia bacterium]